MDVTQRNKIFKVVNNQVNNFIKLFQHNNKHAEFEILYTYIKKDKRYFALRLLTGNHLNTSEYSIEKISLWADNDYQYIKVYRRKGLDSWKGIVVRKIEIVIPDEK